MSKDYYLTGTMRAMGQREAMSIAAQNCAVARFRDPDWIVYTLADKPRQPGQKAFILTPDEREQIERCPNV